MTITKERIIGEIVAENYTTAEVFKKYRIDFCCKGNRSIDEVCRTKNIASEELINDLSEITQQSSGETIDFKSWPLDLLVDYIEKKHHRYVTEKTAQILPYLDKICKVHGKQHPELFEIATHFKASAGELTMHMKKEELILFPFIKKMTKAKMTNVKIDSPHFGTVQNPIEMMLHEHDTEGERFRAIDDLSNHYTPPSDACGTYKVTFSLLKEFENDLHQHIHLENNILFPKAITMEQKLSC